jgi:hypothetical protein
MGRDVTEDVTGDVTGDVTDDATGLVVLVTGLDAIRDCVLEGHSDGALAHPAMLHASVAR